MGSATNLIVNCSSHSSALIINDVYQMGKSLIMSFIIVYGSVVIYSFIWVWNMFKAFLHFGRHFCSFLFFYLNYLFLNCMKELCDQIYYLFNLNILKFSGWEKSVEPLKSVLGVRSTTVLKSEKIHTSEVIREK